MATPYAEDDPYREDILTKLKGYLGESSDGTGADPFSSVASSTASDAPADGSETRREYDMPGDDGSGGLGGDPATTAPTDLTPPTPPADSTIKTGAYYGTKPVMPEGGFTDVNAEANYNRELADWQARQQTAYTGQWAGFDPARMPGAENDASGSLKYDFVNIAKKYDPLRTHTDRAYAEQMLAELDKLHPGAYELDKDGNFLLTGTADGYIGGRPEDYGNSGVAWDESGAQPWQWQWHGYNPAHPGPNGEVGASTSNAASSFAPVLDSGGTPDTPIAPQNDTGTQGTGDLGARLRKLLMDQLGMDPYSVSIDDPSLKNAQEAYYRTRERALQAQREATAERLNAQGLGGGSGAMDAATDRAYQAMGQDVANNASTLVIGELERRKTYLESLMKISAGLLTADQDAQVRMQIAQLSAEISRRAQDIQNQQYYDDLGYRIGTTEANLNAQASGV